MANFFKTMFPCFSIGTGERGIQLPVKSEKYERYNEKFAFQSSTRGSEKWRLCSDEAASSIVSVMLSANDTGPDLDASIRSLVHQAGGWSEYLASKILSSLEVVLKAGKEMNPAMQEAYDKACEAAKPIKGFIADHPVATAVFCTVVALGVLVVLAPYVLEFLGFGELGPIEGTWAAAWQSTFRGSVPKGSLFSYFQRLGMTWRHV
ncbi:hypothetical protein P7C71_g2169, partial [Lecanoromycetidae sp. Uapishka_2]